MDIALWFSRIIIVLAKQQSKHFLNISHGFYLDGIARQVDPFLILTAGGHIVLGDKYLFKAQFLRLGNTLLHPVHGTYLTGEADLSCKTGFERNRNIFIGRDNGCRESEVDSRVPPHGCRR